VAETFARLAIAAVIALLVGWLDEPLTSHDLAWWVCALIGLVLAFGGWLVLVVVDD